MELSRNRIATFIFSFYLWPKDNNFKNNSASANKANNINARLVTPMFGRSKDTARATYLLRAGLMQVKHSFWPSLSMFFISIFQERNECFQKCQRCQLKNKKNASKISQNGFSNWRVLIDELRQACRRRPTRSKRHPSRVCTQFFCC